MTPEQRTMVDKAFEWKSKVLGRDIKIICRDLYGAFGYEEEFKVCCFTEKSEPFTLYEKHDLYKLEE